MDTETAHSATPGRAHARLGRLTRKLARGERRLLLEHLLRLNETDRCRRFCGVVSDRHISRYCLVDDNRYRIVVGYFADGVMRGAGEIVFAGSPVPYRKAEMALSVESPYQDRGVGTHLLRCLLVVARNRGVSEVIIFSQRDNRRIRTLARKFGATFAYRGSEAEMRIAPPPANQLTMLEESLNDSYALWRTFFSACWGTTGPAVTSHQTRPEANKGDGGIIRKSLRHL